MKRISVGCLIAVLLPVLTAVQAASADTAAALKQAEGLFGARQYSQAEPIYRKVLQSDPNNAEAVYQAGKMLPRIFVATDRLPQAQEAIEQLLARSAGHERLPHALHEILDQAKTLDGKDIHLEDYRGKFVQLSFWQPASHPDLDRLKELHKTYGGTDKFQIIGLGGNDTLEEVKKYVVEHKIEWPEIYFGETWDEGIAGQYGLPGLPYILLVNPEGKIAATWLREEKLTNAVRDALGEAIRAGRVPLKIDYPEPGPGIYSQEYYSLPADYRIPLAEEPPAVLVPSDVTNVARGKPVTSNSPTEPIIGETEMITDGDKRLKYFTEFEPLLSPHRPTHITIDLGQEYEIHAVAWWHEFQRPSVYRDVVVQVAKDAEFTNAVTLYNNDSDNSLGLGQGTDLSYIETNKGWVAGADGVLGRYVRLYSRGSSRNLCVQYTEVEVYGRKPQ